MPVWHLFVLWKRVPNPITRGSTMAKDLYCSASSPKRIILPQRVEGSSQRWNAKSDFYRVQVYRYKPWHKCERHQNSMRPHTTAMSLLHLTCWSCAFGPRQEEKHGFTQCFPPFFFWHLALHFVSIIFKPFCLSLLVVFEFLSRSSAVSSADSAQLQTESTTASWEMQLGTLTKDWPVATRSWSQDTYDQVPPWLWFERIWASQTRTSWKAKKESALKVKARNKNKGFKECEAFWVFLNLCQWEIHAWFASGLPPVQQTWNKTSHFRQFLSCEICSYTGNRGRK